MYTPTSEFTNAVTTRKGGHTTRLTKTIARAKPPFVVSSISTKRYAPAVKTPVRKMSSISPPISTKERLPILRGSLVKQSSGPGTLPNVVTRAKPRHSLPKPTSMPAPTVKTLNVQMSFPSPPVPSARRTLPRKQFLPQPVRITAVGELPPRPSCVPRARIDQPSAGVPEAPMETQGFRVKVSATGPYHLGVARKKPSVTTSTAKTVGRTRATNATVKKPVVVGEYRTETPTRNRRLTQVEPIVLPLTFKSESQAELSPPTSPNLSSFPSQSWTIVVDVDIKGAKTPTTICGDETLSMDVAQKSDFVEMLNDPHAASESIASSPTALLSPTIIQTPESPEEPMLGSDSQKNSPTAEPSAKVSHTVGAATIISPTKNGSASSVANLVRVLEKNRASSPPRASQAGNNTETTVQGAINLARTIFSPLRLASQLATEAVSQRTVGTNVARIRSLFVPPLDKDAKASKNPTTQIEIEMLRAQKKVANGGVVDPRLNRLGSLAAMAIAKKRLTTSTSDSASQA